MTATVQPPRARPAAAPPPPAPPSPAPPSPGVRRSTPWLASLTSGSAVLLACGPVTAVVQGSSWFGYAVAVVALVVGCGVLLHRFGPSAVAAGQCVAMLVLFTVLFTDDGLLGLVPTPGAFGEFGRLVEGAGSQIDTGIAPVQATPEILFIVTVAFGLLTVAVHLAAVAAEAPAAAGVPLLAVFAVPAALADGLLPWWAMAGAAAGFGLLLITPIGIRRQLSGGGALVAVAVVLALVIGAGAGFVGTAGRFEGGGGPGGAGGSIGLSPFASLRGQLDQSTPVELFRVRGLTRPTYLRALTLQQYVPDVGWEATRPAPGVPLPGPVQPQPDVAGEVADIQIQNVAFRDYWLPLYGEPIDVGGLTQEQWLYDRGTGTGYTGRPREEDGWEEHALLPVPTVGDLRAAQGSSGVGQEYLDTTGVDPRVGQIAQQAVAGATTNFDRALALQTYFTGPGSPFSYSLQTAPGSGDDALVEFLTVGRVGYCEQFASAMAVMLRTVGVPARVAVGFTAGIDEGSYRSITTSDAHAWVEAWFPGIGWTSFDPTPLTDGRSIEPPYVAEAQTQSAGDQNAPAEDQLPLDSQPDLGAAPTPAAPQAPVPGALDPAVQQGSGLPLWPLLVLLVAAAAGAVPAGVRVLDRRRRYAAVAAGGSAAAAAGWAELLAESADRGVDPPPTDTVRATARRLVREHRLDGDAQQALRQVVSAVEGSWYGGAHPAPDELSDSVRTVAAGIAAGSTLGLRSRLLPPSVLHRLRTRDRGRPEQQQERAPAATRS